MKRLSLLLLLVAACATNPPLSSSSTTSTDAPSGWAGELSAFSAALARVGMSVPLPPRVCEEPPSSCVLSWDDEIGCARIPTSCAVTRREVLSLYAQAITRARKIPAHIARADALVAAYVEGDDSFATLAQQLERDFDAQRAKVPVKKPPAKKGPLKPDVVDAGPPPDAGEPDAGVDAGVVDEPPADDAALSSDAGVPLTLADRIAGTWTAEEGEFRVVFAFCQGGRARFSIENGPPGLGERRGTWSVSEDPDTLTFTSDGRTETQPITAISDDSFTVGEGKDVVTFRLRSRAASCD